MAALTNERIAELLEPYSDSRLPDQALTQLSTYLDLLLRWNVRTNLSAIREPEQIVRRHFGESLFAGGYVPASSNSLLDLGSGAGFPGLPIQLLRPDLKITLAESQNKKAAFLREAVRTLNVATTVWAARVEELPAVMRFDVVTLRAVDNPVEALRLAANRVATGGVLIHLTVGRAGVDEYTVAHSLPESSTVLHVRRLG